MKESLRFRNGTHAKFLQDSFCTGRRRKQRSIGTPHAFGLRETLQNGTRSTKRKKHRGATITKCCVVVPLEDSSQLSLAEESVGSQ
jgi:hypothetical protein